MLTFEFDEPKSRSNLLKHGIHFVDAQLLWNDPRLLEIPANTEDEPRFVLIGLINGRHWSAVATYRGGQYSTDIYASITNRAGGTL